VFETILLLLCFLVIVPILLITIFIYNILRRLRGQTEVSGSDALMDIIREIGNLLKGTNDQSGNTKVKQTTTNSSSPNNKVKPKTQQVEDAEFREV